MPRGAEAPDAAFAFAVFGLDAVFGLGAALVFLATAGFLLAGFFGAVFLREDFRAAGFLPVAELRLAVFFPGEFFLSAIVINPVL